MNEAADTGRIVPPSGDPRNTEPKWREHAVELGVDPNEPDDGKFFHALWRAESLIDSFRYHKPSEQQVARIAEVRQGHIQLAKLILRAIPSSADQTAALRKLHECMMTANKAIVCEAPVVINAG